MTPCATNPNPVPYEPTVLNGTRNGRTRNQNRAGKAIFNWTARFNSVDWTIRSAPGGFHVGQAPGNTSKRLRAKNLFRLAGRAFANDTVKTWLRVVQRAGQRNLKHGRTPVSYAILRTVFLFFRFHINIYYRYRLAGSTPWLGTRNDLRVYNFRFLCMYFFLL